MVYSVSRIMDRPSTSQQSMEKYSVPRIDKLQTGSSQSVESKVEMFEVREHVPYQAEVTRAPGAYDAESGDAYTNSWDSAWLAICQLLNLLHHMQVAIIVFCIWHFALTVEPSGAITNLQLHIIFAGTGYQLFLVEAVLTLHRHNSWSFQLSQDGKRVVHGCLQLIGSLFVIVGSFLALAETDMVVNTAHGFCGVIALAFSLASLISGIIALFSSKVRLMIRSGPIKILHVALGLIALSMGLITIAIGFNMDYFSAENPGLATALMVFVVGTLVYIIVQPIVNLVSTTRKTL